MNKTEELVRFVMEDKQIEQANELFKERMELADGVATVLSKELMDQIMNQEHFTLDLAILSVARTLMYLGQNYFKDDESFKETLTHVREVTADRIPYAIDDPQPCETCDACQAGELCDHPVMDEQMTLRSLPLLAGSILEYSYWTAHMDEVLNAS